MGLQPTFRRSVLLVLVLITLGFGWWPMGFVLRNDVAYDPVERALAFNSAYESGDSSARGGAYAVDALDTRAWPGVTVLIELRGGANKSGLGVFLEFFEEDRDGLPALLISQWQEHLAMRSRRERKDVARGYSEIGHRDLFKSGAFVQLLVASEGNRTNVYVDGQIVESRSDFSLLGPDNKFQGRLAIGNNADGTRPFTGEIRRVAVFDGFYRASSAELAAAAAVLDFDLQQADLPRGLEVSALFHPAKRRFLNTVGSVDWHKPSVRSDVIVNVLGFIPVGICFAALARRRAGSFLAVIVFVGLASFGLSMVIELGQGLLVHRDSSQLDVALNTVSGMLAVLVPRRWVLFL